MSVIARTLATASSQEISIELKGLACLTPVLLVQIRRTIVKIGTASNSLFPSSFFAALKVAREQHSPLPNEQPLLPHLVMPHHHDVRGSDVVARRLHGNLAAAADRGPKDFPELLLTPGVGARTVQALAMVAEVVHGTPCRFTDPARFSFAHGGKDRHPFPVPLRVYDETIVVLKSAMQKARLGREEELGALQRLDEQARILERHARGRSVEQLIANESEHSHSYGGRSVFGWELPPSSTKRDRSAC